MKSEYLFLIETCEKVSGVWENLAKEFQPFDNITLAKVFSDSLEINGSFVFFQETVSRPTMSQKVSNSQF